MLNKGDCVHFFACAVIIVLFYQNFTSWDMPFLAHADDGSQIHLRFASDLEGKINHIIVIIAAIPEWKIAKHLYGVGRGSNDYSRHVSFSNYVDCGLLGMCSDPFTPPREQRTIAPNSNRISGRHSSLPSLSSILNSGCYKNPPQVPREATGSAQTQIKWRKLFWLNATICSIPIVLVRGFSSRTKSLGNY